MSGAVLRAVKVGLSIRVYRCVGNPYAFSDRDKIIEEGTLLGVGNMKRKSISWTGYGARADERNVETWEKLQVII